MQGIVDWPAEELRAWLPALAERVEERALHWPGDEFRPQRVGPLAPVDEAHSGWPAGPVLPDAPLRAELSDEARLRQVGRQLPVVCPARTVRELEPLLQWGRSSHTSGI